MGTANPDSSPEEWLTNGGEPRADLPSVEQVQSLAELLSDNDRLRLVTRLWKTLPRDHQAALATLPLERVQNSRHSNLADVGYSSARLPQESTGPDLMDRIFNREHTSELYSAPRRFDLASIFVVTAAYSILLGALSLMSTPPGVMVVVAGMLGIIAATQAMYQHVANPRGVSIVTGSIVFAIVCGIISLTIRGVLSGSLFVDVIIVGLPCGAILGYLMGTVVGGVFLVADMMRKRMEGVVEKPSAEDSETEAVIGTEQVATSKPQSVAT
jgi:hypothetical protein